MKRVRIDFAHGRRWIAIWLPACAIMGGVLGAALQQGRMIEAATRNAQQSRARLATESAEALKAQAQYTADRANDSRRTELQGVAAALLRDWNPAFATVENMRQPGMRLLLLHLDAASGTIRVEYELESVAQAAALTADLNAGFAAAPWRLETIGGTAAPAVGRSGRVRAAWNTRLDALR